MITIRTIFVFLFTIILFSSFGQSSRLNFKHLTPKEGLTQSVITGIYTDTKGFVWMTGMDGINRFDGSHCIANNEIAPGMNITGQCKGIAEDKNGDIWIGYVDGIIQYSYYSNRFTIHNLSFTKKIQDKNRAMVFFPIVGDDGNNLLIGGFNGGEMLLYNTVSKETVIMKKPVLQSNFITLYTPIRIHSLKQDWKWILASTDSVFICSLKGWQNGNLLWDIKTIKLDFEISQTGWMPDGNTLFYFANNRICKHNLSVNSKSYSPFVRKSSPILSFFPDAKGHLWVSGTNKCLQVLDTGSLRWVMQISYNANNSNSISSENPGVYIDQNQMLWATAFGKGIDYTSLKEERFTSYLTADEARANHFSNFIRGITEVADGNFYCSTQSGIIVLDKDLQYKKILSGSNPASHYPDVLADGKKLFYVCDLGITTGLFQYDFVTGNTEKIFYPGTKGKENIDGYQLYKMADKKLMVASLRGLLIYDEAKRSAETPRGISNLQEFDEMVVYSYEDGLGQVYKCLQTNGFFVYKKKSDSYKEVFVFNKSITVKQIVPKNNSQLWIATDDGLYLFNNTELKIEKHYTTNEGLPNNVVYAMIPDENNNLWLSTNKGLCYFDISKNSFTNFTQEDGLQANEFNTHVAIKAKDGRMIFGGVNGLTVVNPSVITASMQQPQLQFTSLKTDSTLNPFPFNEQGAVLILNAGTTSFDAQLTAINFNNPALCKIKYRLKGYDDEWQYLSNPGTFRFNKLPAGSYILEAMASNTRGEFGNDIRKLTVIVKSYWWQTDWFKMAAIFFSFLLAALIIRGYLRRKIKRQKEILERQMAVQQERERIIADLHDDVGGTLSSMYIYGDLAGEVWETKPEQSKEMVEKITIQAKELMNRMGDIVWSLKPFGEDKSALAGRLKNYSTELLAAKNIVCEFQIDEAASKIIINPMARKNIMLIAKEAMNNIAKYSNASIATISIYQQNDNILLVIKDNGSGIDLSKLKPGNGLQNMQQRCEMLKGKFMLNTSPGNGTHITCYFPIAIISHTG